MSLFNRIIKFIGLVLLVIGVNVMPMILIGNQSKTPIMLQWVFGLLYLVLAFLIIRKVWKTYLKKEDYKITGRPFTLEELGIAVLFFFGARLVAVVGTLLLQKLTGNAMSANDAALQASASDLKNMFPLYFVAFQVMIGFFAPVLEELTFRGFFSRYFFKKDNKWAKWLVSSLIFALLHAFKPIELIMYFALGSVFFFAFRREENIRDSIVVHMMNNGLIVIFSVFNYILLLMGVI
ncbi:CPBP family intramembrane glutamic endopeptidase [Streptococcus thoraltensis]|uniref:CPBP family intramembrane glutamic endopeptidase n=1 Tax=Streptococcus thoraltensis TaxID=55085 RepID=UPI001F5713FD|nr:type II CAAX endopeptidase family protein [Streptococcus thoraltensis]